jgi:hypothetical protein
LEGDGRCGCLQAQLASAQARLQESGTDLEAWHAALAARDSEIQNLQVPLHSFFQ